ncbi:MAG: hypothetical protein R6V75_08450, partial [Bacteroidales bacterium]
DSAAATNLIPVPADRVWEIIRKNRQGIIVDRLLEIDSTRVVEEIGYMNAAGQESLTRFDHKKGPRKKFRPRPGNKDKH